MGTEALVEVHTPEELEYALSVGATMFIITRWDRVSGQLHKEQVPHCHQSVSSHHHRNCFIDLFLCYYQTNGLISLIPGNCVAVAAGNFVSEEEVS